MSRPPEPGRGAPPGLDERLPPGRHGLDREEVRAHQRRRLLAATAGAVLELGYPGLTLAEITARAGVSRVTFYQLFEDKPAILRAACEEAFAALREAIGAACEKQPAWPENALAGLRAATAFALAEPAQAALVTGATICLEPQLAASLRAANAELAGILRAARPASRPGEPPLPEILEETLIGGLAGVIAGELAAGRRAELAARLPELGQALLAPYLGAAAARRAAASAVLAPA